MTTKQRILATLAYADVFDFPLTRSELRQWIIGPVTPLIPKNIQETEQSISHGVTYFTLSGRISIVHIRIARALAAYQKWLRIRRIARRFLWIPTVRLVGVSGGFAVDNARAEDDIDLFFITERGSLWVTRLLVTVTADLLGLRRRPRERIVDHLDRIQHARR